jgi:hypothetical protein
MYFVHHGVLLHYVLLANNKQTGSSMVTKLRAQVKQSSTKPHAKHTPTTGPNTPSKKHVKPTSTPNKGGSKNQQRPETNDFVVTGDNKKESASTGGSKTTTNRDAASKKQIQKDAKMLARLAGKEVPNGKGPSNPQRKGSSNNNSARIETVATTAQGGSGRIGREGGECCVCIPDVFVTFRFISFHSMII